MALSWIFCMSLEEAPGILSPPLLDLPLLFLPLSSLATFFSASSFSWPISLTFFAFWEAFRAFFSLDFWLLAAFLAFLEISLAAFFIFSLSLATLASALAFLSSPSLPLLLPPEDLGTASRLSMMVAFLMSPADMKAS